MSERQYGLDETLTPFAEYAEEGKSVEQANQNYRTGSGVAFFRILL
ncbi:hypothetical protein [Mixta mediterraneensis]|nr:hypothetical protein [Mixta mediterraneensis]MBE5251670.1 hypothetical protein [Mixta mediterraneensis]